VVLGLIQGNKNKQVLINVYVGWQRTIFNLGDYFENRLRGIFWQKPDCGSG
jgi:hypothetical protein